jgi:hypothetical protein
VSPTPRSRARRFFELPASSVQRHLVVDPLLGIGGPRKINRLDAFFP